MVFRTWQVATLLAAVLFAPACHALKFKSIEDDSILLIYDCGTLGFPDERGAEGCRNFEKGFAAQRKPPEGDYAGDSAVLKRILSKSNHYRQVWLHSGGGNLIEGIGVGAVLREFNQYVYVPKGARCVSACTVAFLGGRLRDVHPEGSYEVHAYSGLLNLTAAQVAPLMQPDGEFELDGFAGVSSENGRKWAKRLFVYAQSMIGGSPDAAAVERTLASVPDLKRSYRTSGQLERDLIAIHRDGAATAQEVLMRIEREAFNSALSAIKNDVGSLGERAGPAVTMLEIMFSSRITGTSVLDQTTLRERGYINVRR